MTFKEELEEILLKAGVPKGIHRVKLDTEIGADRYSPENVNKISTTDTFTEALTSIINLVDKDVIQPDQESDHQMSHRQGKRLQRAIIGEEK